MIDTTTPKDLAQKIEWIGLRSLTYAERERVASELVETSKHLPKLLATALWTYFGERAPQNLLTRGAERSDQSFKERQGARSFVAEIMKDYSEEENSF